MTRVRIGIDVGGTFTDVVAVDNTTQELIGQLKIPTTHSASEGVARGIVCALEEGLARFAVQPEDVAFIAHSTTQATNALLEGDVAPVGIIGLGSGLESWLARSATRVPPIPLTPARALAPRHLFLKVRDGLPPPELDCELRDFGNQGVRVVVASEAFGVDHPEREDLIAERARAAGFFATTGHEVSGLYGLRARTRTAVINAAILPKMIETATMTDRCVRATGIKAPLMIMRSDGGVMSVAEVHRRPILTMLSGPAAGIAGALMHERVSDGIFIEVGGTSADISVIRDGSPALRPARLNGHRMYLHTLDVRTVGIAGGSMVRLERSGKAGARILGVGPRSAHIAGFGYACFAEPEAIAGGRLEWIRPLPGDSADHVIVRTPDGRGCAVTATCAANLLGLAKPGHFAYGNPEAARAAFGLLAAALGHDLTPEAVAELVLREGCRILVDTIEQLVAEYRLDRAQVVLVGGGGGAAALVPFAARLLSFEHRIARNAEVISPLGVAMAMVRDTVERNIVDPTPEDIVRIRREAADAAVAAGALADSVEVQVEVDKRRNLVKAVALGTTEIRRADGPREECGEAACREAAARSMHLDPGSVSLAAETPVYRVYTGRQRRHRRFWWPRQFREMLRVVHRTGVVRLQKGVASLSRCTADRLPSVLEREVDLLTDFGDAGRTIPDLLLLYGARIANFSGLSDLPQVLALVGVELRDVDPATTVVVIACPKNL
jgi:N-methylhydantoinase A